MSKELEAIVMTFIFPVFDLPRHFNFKKASRRKLHTLRALLSKAEEFSSFNR